MKQHITEEQWNELSQEQKTVVCNWYDDELEQCLHVNRYPPTIGEMIAFLGDGIIAIRDIEKNPEVELGEEFNFIRFSNTEICDALWQAVKYKLIKK